MGEEKKSIRESVLSAIEAGKVTMKPRWYFAARAALLVLGMVLASMAVVYVVSFIFFMLHQTGIWFTPAFGFRGMREFLFGLPWMLILISVLFITVLQLLVKKYSFRYGRPLLYSTFGIMGLAFIGGFILSLTPVHRGLFKQAQQGHLPVAGGFYRQFGNPPPRGNVLPGTIAEVRNGGYVIYTSQNELIMVTVTPHTRFPFGSHFEKGDNIVVIGERIENSIIAVGIRKVSNETFAPRSGNGAHPPSGARSSR